MLVFGEVVFVISDPICSMYEIFAYMSHKNQPNVGKYSIHGWYGGMIPYCRIPNHHILCWAKRRFLSFGLPVAYYHCTFVHYKTLRFGAYAYNKFNVLCIYIYVY